MFIGKTQSLDNTKQTLASRFSSPTGVPLRQLALSQLLLNTHAFFLLWNCVCNILNLLIKVQFSSLLPKIAQKGCCVEERVPKIYVSHDLEPCFSESFQSWGFTVKSRAFLSHSLELWRCWEIGFDYDNPARTSKPASIQLEGIFRSGFPPVRRQIQLKETGRRGIWIRLSWWVLFIFEIAYFESLIEEIGYNKYLDQKFFFLKLSIKMSWF